MKTPHNRISYLFLFLVTTLFLLTGFSTQTFAQGKKVYVGTGSGFIDYEDAQNQLNLKDEDTVMINSGNYKNMTFKHITASAGHRIYIMNSGQVNFNDPQPSWFSHLTNVSVEGDGTPGIDFGFYMHDLIRAIYIDSAMSGVYFSYIKMVNIADYSIFINDSTLVYDGTNNANSLVYDLKFLHFSVHNIATSWLQMGLYARIVDDGSNNSGMGLKSMMRKLEVAYCTVDSTDQEDVLHLNKVVNANIHHNRFTNLGAHDFRHTGIIYLYGNGDVHHNYIANYWGSGLRAHAFSLDTVGAINVYDNIMVNSRKYSGVEAQCTPEDIAYSPYLHYCNFKIYNNTFGDLSAFDWNASMVDTYDAVGGTIEIKNNLGYNIQRDKPYNPTWNYVYQQLNVTLPDTSNNLYNPNYLNLGLTDTSSGYLNAGSPAIDKGKTLSLVTDDIDGVARPQGTAYDIGAREYVSGVVYPVSNAGKDTTALLPKDSVLLNGTASYNPGGGVLKYKWSEVSGPSAAVLLSDTSANPMLDSLVRGTYKIKLTVTNTQGYSNDDTVLVVVSPLVIAAPVAKAGGTITITLPVNSTALNGSASISNNGGALKYAWTKLSGPASFAISGDTTAAPFVSALTAGTYLVKLTVTDTNMLSGSDVDTIIVNPAPVPVANAGSDIFLTLPVNSASLDGSASTTPAGVILTYAWSLVSGPSSFSISGANTVNPVVSNLTPGTYQIKLTVTNTAGLTNSDYVNIIVAAAPVAVANAGADINLVLPDNTTTLNGTASSSSDGGALTYTWSLVSGPSSLNISGANTATPTISNLVAGTYQVNLHVTNAHGSAADDVVTVTVSAMTVYPPVGNAGPDVTITLPTNSTTLNGELSYNPAGGALTYAWSLITGPSSFTITGAATATPGISNLTEGAYQIQLKVTNAQGASSEDTVTITVSPAPAAPPVANAGANITLVLPANSTGLDGSGSSNAAGGALTYAWSLISGPASFTITAASTATPAVSNLVQGIYNIKLIVTNARGLTAEAIVTVTVNLPAPPVVNAGSSVSITLPVNSVTLNGSASYNPAGGALSYSWSKVSGPAAFTITDNATATPFVSNLVQGNYQVQLTVTNSAGVASTGVVDITVNLVLLSVANAGPDTTISFPGGYAILNGTGSYSQSGTISSYQWKQVSGPTTSVINNSTASKTTATNLEPGVYVFQLSVSDNYGAQSTTTFKVNVVSALRYFYSLKLYPNPCTDLLHIHALTDSTGSLVVRITNMSGIVMLNQTYQKSQLTFDQAVPVSRFPAGMYIVEVVMNGYSELTSKFIKK